MCSCTCLTVCGPCNQSRPRISSSALVGPGGRLMGEMYDALRTCQYEGFRTRPGLRRGDLLEQLAAVGTVQGAVIFFDLAHVRDGFLVAPTLDVGRDGFDALPGASIELLGLGDVGRPLDGALPRVIAAEHEPQSLLVVGIVGPNVPEIAAEQDAGRDVPF